MKVTFVRHGEVPHNLKRVLGVYFKEKLNKNGIIQTKKLAKRLSKEKFDIIYCSDIVRTKESAKIIRKYHANTPIIYTKELREINWGEFNGKPTEYWRESYKNSGKSIAEFRPKGGESLGDVRKRISNFIKKIYKKYKGKHILIVAHGGVNKIMRDICKNRPVKEYTKKQREQSKQDNCCVNILQFKKNKAKLILYNCTKHLKK